MLETERRVGYLIKRAQQALRGAMDRALRDVGVTTPQYAVLTFLAGEADLSNADLARRAFVTPQTMNEMLATLEARGLVVRTARPAHGRIQPARLTDHGRDVLTACNARIVAVEERLVSGLDARERHRLADALERCVEALEPASFHRA